MQNHKYDKANNSILCKICWLPKLHMNHLDNLTQDDIIESKLPQNDTRVAEVILDTPLTTAQEKAIESNEHTNQPNCYGHKCPQCGIQWEHNYKCWPQNKNEFCPAHFGQANVEIHRNEDILRMLQIRVSDPRDIAELMLEHEAFVVLEATKSPDYDAWIDAHIKNLRETIEKCNAKISAAQTGRMRLREKDLEKLTPEEIEALRNNARRQKKAKEPKPEDTGKAWKEQLSSLAKIVGKDVAEAKLTELWKSKGKEIPNENN